MNYINGLHDEMTGILDNNNILRLQECLGISADHARVVVKELSFGEHQMVSRMINEGVLGDIADWYAHSQRRKEYNKISGGSLDDAAKLYYKFKKQIDDGTYQSVKSPLNLAAQLMGKDAGQLAKHMKRAGLPEDDNPYDMSSGADERQLNIDPDELEIGDNVGFVDARGDVQDGQITDVPDVAGRMKIKPSNGGMDNDVELRDLQAPDDAQIQDEILRLQKLAGIGGVSPDMDESASGGASGAGGIGGSAVGRINPASRKHSPHGSAFKSARSKTSEYKRTLSKRGPKK